MGGGEGTSRNEVYNTWGGFPNFCASYGLRYYEDADVQEAKEIADQMIKHDQERKEEEE
jgi:hypothetical protein